MAHQQCQANNDGAIRKVDWRKPTARKWGLLQVTKTDRRYVGNKVKFDNRTNPNTRLYNGDSTCIEIISKSGPAVNAHSTSFKKPTTCPCSPKACGLYKEIVTQRFLPVTARNQLPA